MPDTNIPTPGEPGPMSVEDAANFLVAPAEEQPIDEDEVDAAPDAEEAEEAAPDEISDEPEGDPEVDEVDEGSEPDDETEEEFITVKVNGEEMEVSLSEAVNGYSRTEDYKQKTRLLSEERKAMEAEHATKLQEVEQARIRYAAFLDQEPVEPDWDKIREEDPIGYAEQWADHQRAKQAREMERTRMQAETEQRRNQFVQETGAQAVSVFPEWSEAGGYQKGAEARTKAAQSLGFTAEEVASNHDYRVFAMLEKAARYDALMAEKSNGKARVVKKVRQAPAKLKSSARKTKGAEAAENEKARVDRLRRTGSIDDAVALLMEG